MNKKPPIFKQIKRIYSQNPLILWMIGWVMVIPSAGALLLFNYLYQHPGAITGLNLQSFAFYYIIISSLLMGLALVPTTFLSIVSGFIFGWKALPLLILAYSFATITGYWIGRKMDKNSLEGLYRYYPKAEKLILQKQDNIGELIFFVRLSPVIPFALSNLLFALLKIDWKKVVWVGILGMLPRTLMAFFSGILAESLYSAVQSRNGLQETFFVLILIMISIWGIMRFFKRKGSNKIH